MASEYVEWRWAKPGGVADNRWFGSIHKQALARLWWAGELFRDGADYSPVERALVRQDIVNSYLHRPLVRCRSLGIGILNVLIPLDGGTVHSADMVNDVARALNLCTAGTPPEAEVGFRGDDITASIEWAQRQPEGLPSWDLLPLGPHGMDTTRDSVDAGTRIAERGLLYAPQVAIARGSRSAQRRAKKLERSTSAVPLMK
jgi:hypothetical protein